MHVDTLFCDDIRQEASGKHLLIGVYTGELVSYAAPATFPIALWLKIAGLPAQSRKFVVEVTTDDGVNAFKVNGDLVIAEPSLPAVLVLGGIPITVVASTTLRAVLTLDDGPPLEISNLAMRVSPTDPPSS